MLLRAVDKTKAELLLGFFLHPCSWNSSFSTMRELNPCNRSPMASGSILNMLSMQKHVFSRCWRIMLASLRSVWLVV